MAKLIKKKKQILRKTSKSKYRGQRFKIQKTNYEKWQLSISETMQVRGQKTDISKILKGKSQLRIEYSAQKFFKVQLN